ncbi:HAMP domain-containing sensor histidine kinase [Mycoplasmatota bacterium WC30]
MKTQNSIKTIFSLIIITVLITIGTLVFYFVQRENDINDSQNINVLRAYTSPIMNLVNEDFPTMDDGILETRLDELNINALVSDLSNNILYNNTSFNTSDVVHELYQDQSYSLNNPDMVKVAFPIEAEYVIVGLVIFEIPKAELIDGNYIFFSIILIFETLVLVSLIVFLVISYKLIIVNPINRLNKALLDISNGIYNKLNSNKGISIKSFTNYNIMLDKMENTLSIQADYEKSRKQLIANISHEIRTPLSYVKMSAEILAKDECINVSNKKYIETILNKITSIDGIIEDLFRYSKQDLDKLLVELKETYAKDMFERIFSEIKPKDKNKNISITINNDIPNVLINADENRLVQVVSNMVDNAEKHIQKTGFINIKTEIDENHLVLTIEDSGEGIEPKDLPYIFEAFYQGKQDDNTKKKGAGLGLAICDYIIKKHNGEIFVYSERNKGTKFVIKLQEIL